MELGTVPPMRLRIGLIAILALMAGACSSPRASDGGYETAAGDSFALESLDGQASVVLFWDPG